MSRGRSLPARSLKGRRGAGFVDHLPQESTFLRAVGNSVVWPATAKYNPVREIGIEGSGVDLTDNRGRTAYSYDGFRPAARMAAALAWNALTRA
jgi:hypothetical protein